jgi:hypothetical protein
MISAAETVPWRIDAARRENFVPVDFEQPGIDAVGKKLVERPVVLFRRTNGDSR